MIFKLLKLSKCTLLSKVLSQAVCRNIHASKVCPAIGIKSDTDKSHSLFATKLGRRVRKASVKVNKKHIESITAVLKKHNIDTSNFDYRSKIFHDTSWGVERKIMLLEELGAAKITVKFISMFHRRLLLPVKIFKKYISLSHDECMAKNLFNINNCSFDPQELGISEDQLTKVYLHQCLIHYAKEKLELNKTQLSKLKSRNNHISLYNSFRLFSKVLQFLQDEIKLTKSMIIKHHVVLFPLHPDQFQIIYNLVAEIAKERTASIARRYPPMFEHNIEDLKITVSFLKKHVSCPEKIAICHIVRIFQMTSDELKKRYNYFSKNCYTQNLLNHPKFMNLIALYHCVLPRIRYLQEKNLQYASIQSLTTFAPNYHENLTAFKGVSTRDMKSFFLVNFGDDAEQAWQEFRKHVYYRFVPLLAMRKSLDYLKRLFPDDIVKKNCYAILYNQIDLQAAYEVVTKNPDYCKLPPNQLLAMCLYKIELNNHFMGDPVLAPGKYAESLKDNVKQGD